MNIIKQGQDFQYQIHIKNSEGQEIYITTQNYYEIKVYTNDSRTWINATDYVNSTNLLSFDSNILKPLSSGQIHLKVLFSENNPLFQDGMYDQIRLINTDSFYDSENRIAQDETAKWGMIYGNLSEQTDLINMIDTKISDKTYVKVTQEEYDHLVETDQIKENTLYVIPQTENQDANLAQNKN